VVFLQDGKSQAGAGAEAQTKLSFIELKGSFQSKGYIAIGDTILKKYARKTHDSSAVSSCG
jgi:hypothetical protein